MTPCFAPMFSCRQAGTLESAFAKALAGFLRSFSEGELRRVIRRYSAADKSISRRIKGFMLENILSGYEIRYLIKLLFCLFAGLMIGSERESRGKSAGISTHTFVITGSMTFTVLSFLMDPASPARIASQIVSGIGFLGAGIILKREEGRIINLTTAASIWFSASIGMMIGFDWYICSLFAVAFAVLVFKIPAMPIQSEPKSKDPAH